MISDRSLTPSGTAACRELARQIQTLVETGFGLDDNTLNFIDTTFARADVRYLSQLLNDPDGCESAMLIDLIISPDQVMAAALEDFLGQSGFEDGDERRVCSYLPDCLKTSIRFPDDRGVVSFTVAHASLVRFVEQLRIGRRICPELRQELRLRFSDLTDCLSALVAIRHARVSLTEDKSAFLTRFTRQSAATANVDWFYDFKLILDVLDREKSVGLVPAALALEKANCRRQLEAAEQFEQALEKNNIETLMMQKSRGGVLVDRQPLLYRIGRIDSIGWKIFGRPLTELPCDCPD